MFSILERGRLEKTFGNVFDFGEGRVEKTVGNVLNHGILDGFEALWFVY